MAWQGKLLVCAFVIKPVVARRQYQVHRHPRP